MSHLLGYLPDDFEPPLFALLQIFALRGEVGSPFVLARFGLIGGKPQGQRQRFFCVTSNLSLKTLHLL